jgi:hypothetical protein
MPPTLSQAEALVVKPSVGCQARSARAIAVVSVLEDCIRTYVHDSTSGKARS